MAQSGSAENTPLPGRAGQPGLERWLGLLREQRGPYGLALWCPLALLCLSVWPVRGALWDDLILGAGPDVISTLWGMWWFTQEWLGAAWGGWSDLSNHPWGSWGAVLSPTSAALWGITEPLIGVGRASALVGVGQAGGMAVATAWLAHRVGACAGGAFLAGLVPLTLRYTWYGLGEGSVVAIAGVFVPLGLIGLIDGWQHSGRRGWSGIGLVVVCAALSALENPYLAPVLPVALLGALAWASLPAHRTDRRPRRLGVGLVGGVIGIAIIAQIFTRVASPDYPPRQVESTHMFFGWALDVIDKPWARAELGELIWPGPVRWTLDINSGESAVGGDYLGLVGVVLAVLAGVLDKRRAWPFLLLAGGSLVVALGSLVMSVPAPFLLLNSIMDLVSRPLTQPTRYLVVFGVAGGVAAGLAVTALRQRFGSRVVWPIGGLMLIDACGFGGLSLDLPTTAMPDAPCVTFLRAEEGAVLIWPGDASRWEGDLMRGWMMQILHERPSSQPGIASWALHDERARDVIRDRGRYRYMAPVGEPLGEPVSRPDLGFLYELGFRWVIVDVERDPRQTAWAEQVFGPSVSSCSGAEVHSLQPDG